MSGGEDGALDQLGWFSKQIKTLPAGKMDLGRRETPTAQDKPVGKARYILCAAESGEKGQKHWPNAMSALIASAQAGGRKRSWQIFRP